MCIGSTRCLDEGDSWRLWRAAPGFHQRFTGRLSEDGQTIRGRWEMSEDGREWRTDFDLTYTRTGPG